MNEIADYPLAPFVNALRTMLGRLVLCVVAVVFGAFLGGLTATNSWAGGIVGIAGIIHLAFGSIFFGVGVVALPAAFLFIVLFARSEWPLWTVLIATLLIWWNTHKVLDWFLHQESALSKIEKMTRAAAEKAEKRHQEERKKKEEDKAQ